MTILDSRSTWGILKQAQHNLKSIVKREQKFSSSFLLFQWHFNMSRQYNKEKLKLHDMTMNGKVVRRRIAENKAPSSTIFLETLAPNVSEMFYYSVDILSIEYDGSTM